MAKCFPLGTYWYLIWTSYLYFQEIREFQISVFFFSNLFFRVKMTGTSELFTFRKGVRVSPHYRELHAKQKAREKRKLGIMCIAYFISSLDNPGRRWNSFGNWWNIGAGVLSFPRSHLVSMCWKERRKCIGPHLSHYFFQKTSVILWKTLSWVLKQQKSFCEDWKMRTALWGANIFLTEFHVILFCVGLSYIMNSGNSLLCLLFSTIPFIPLALSNSSV